MSLVQGGQFWRLDGNLLKEPGYPKPLESEFPQLSGNVTAALALPATGGSPETVFFFRNGKHTQQKDQYRKSSDSSANQLPLS